MIRSEICDMLKIRYPVFQGGMAWIADGALAAAVSNGGGLGIMGAYKPRRGRKGHEANNHPLCGCASKVIPKNSPSWYNDVVQASL